MSRLSNDWEKLFSYVKSDMVTLDEWIAAEEKKAFIGRRPSGLLKSDHNLDARSVLPWVDAYKETR